MGKEPDKYTGTRRDERGSRESRPGDETSFSRSDGAQVERSSWGAVNVVPKGFLALKCLLLAIYKSPYSVLVTVEVYQPT